MEFKLYFHPIEKEGMRYLLFFLFVGFLSDFLAQSKSYVAFEILDSRSNEAIPNGKISLRIKNQDTTYVSLSFLSAGKLIVALPINETFEATISHPIYETNVFQFVSPKRVDDTLQKVIFGTRSKIQLQQEVIAKAPGVPSVVFGSDRLSVSDFELMPNGEILLLVYPKRLDKGSELVLYKNQAVQHSFKLKENPIELIRDYRGTPHVVCESGVFGIHRSENQIGISTLDKEYFMRYIFPIVDTVQSKLFFSNYSDRYPAFDYMVYDQHDSTYATILNVQDDLMMELFRSEYKWVDVRTKLWAKNLELETGIDKEIWVGTSYFTQSIYYKELYAPLFRRNDSIFVFDYYKDQLFTFDSVGRKLDSVAIYHHYQPKQSGWKGKLIQDSETGQVYAYFEKNGNCQLKLVDLKTGQLTESVLLPHKYIEKIAIQGNAVYYIYRPFESLQKKYLYSTKLPFNFPIQSTTQGNFISIDTGK